MDRIIVEVLGGLAVSGGVIVVFLAMIQIVTK
jgi:hypothetical protein